MSTSAKKVTCDCGATIRASSDADLIELVQAHATTVHHLELTASQILAMAEPA